LKVNVTHLLIFAAHSEEVGEGLGEDDFEGLMSGYEGDDVLRYMGYV